jgi:hypothetical protein
VYDPDQTNDPTSGVQLPSRSAAVQVYLQAFKAHEETFPSLFIEVWRANYALAGGRTSANIAVKVPMEEAAQPCTNDITQAPHRLGLMGVNAGSPIIDIAGDQFEFDITDWDGNVVQRGCSFTGTGTYKPRPTVNQEIAGYLTCSGGYRVACDLPVYPAPTTCGTGDATTCGDVGKNCNPYYQILARCVV